MASRESKILGSIPCWKKLRYCPAAKILSGSSHDGPTRGDKTRIVRKQPIKRANAHTRVMTISLPDFMLPSQRDVNEVCSIFYVAFAIYDIPYTIYFSLS